MLETILSTSPQVEATEAVTSLCWQRSKPVIVNESNCTAENALMGDSVEESVLMPDPMTSATSSSVSLSMGVSNSRNPSCLGTFIETSSITVSSSGFASTMLTAPTAEETPHQSRLLPGGTLSRLHAPRTSYNLKDDMEVFSPLVDVQPITPSLWDENGAKMDNIFAARKPSPLLYPSSSDHPIFDWKSGSTSKQDETRSSFPFVGSSPPSSKNEHSDSSITPPEAWGGEKLSDKYAYRLQPINAPSHLGMLASSGETAGSMFSGLHNPSSSVGIRSFTNSSFSNANLRAKDVSTSQEDLLSYPNHDSFSSMPLSINTKAILGQSTIDSPGMSSFTIPRRFSSYAERLSTTSTFNGVSFSVGLHMVKKSGAETRELLNSLLLKSDVSVPTESGSLQTNGRISRQQKASDPQGTSFTLQLFRRTLEETLDSFQKFMHEDMRNLHIEILRQFHTQEMEMSNVMNSILENQAKLMKEVKSLRKENQQLEQLL
ncbi:hypothetical protein L6164_032965 [Bauhinia variegata]|uniref:Uncharacterized protein n=1 Tax=Bauhinia variegata TaxID=167791 RepID=A0ACB9KQ81_BAUVA|nr:hypothetical protein L6164_032965 [Bauhinia variegata]